MDNLSVNNNVNVNSKPVAFESEQKESSKKALLAKIGAVAGGTIGLIAVGAPSAVAIGTMIATMPFSLPVMLSATCIGVAFIAATIFTTAAFAYAGHRMGNFVQEDLGKLLRAMYTAPPRPDLNGG